VDPRRSAILICSSAVWIGLATGTVLAQTGAPPRSPGAIERSWSLVIQRERACSRSRAARTPYARQVEPTLRLGSRVTFDLAYEHRLRVTSGSGDSLGAGLGVLPSAPPPCPPGSARLGNRGGPTRRLAARIDRAALHGQVSASRSPPAGGPSDGAAASCSAPSTCSRPFRHSRPTVSGGEAPTRSVRRAPVSRASADVVLAFGARGCLRVRGPGARLCRRRGPGSRRRPSRRDGFGGSPARS
jgi:hypothetical protein